MVIDSARRIRTVHEYRLALLRLLATKSYIIVVHSYQVSFSGGWSELKLNTLVVESRSLFTVEIQESRALWEMFAVSLLQNFAVALKIRMKRL